VPKTAEKVYYGGTEDNHKRLGNRHNPIGQVVAIFKRRKLEDALRMAEQEELKCTERATRKKIGWTSLSTSVGFSPLSRTLTLQVIMIAVFIRGMRQKEANETCFTE